MDKQSRIRRALTGKILLPALLPVVLLAAISCSATRSLPAKRQPVDVDRVMAVYDSLAGRHNYAAAMDLLDAALKNRTLEEDHRLWLRCQRAGIHLLEENYAKADRKFGKIYRRNGDNFYVNLCIGRLYYNRGIHLMAEANLIVVPEKYLAKKEVSMGFFRKAMAYFEKAKELSGSGNYAKTYTDMINLGLRGIYYTLDMGREFDRIEKEMNNN